MNKLQAAFRLRAFGQIEKEEEAIRRLQSTFPDGASWPSKEHAIELINKEGFVDQHTGKPLVEDSCWYDLGDVPNPKGDYLHIRIPEGVSKYNDLLCLDFKNKRVHIS